MTFELPVQYTEKTGGDATGYLKFGDSPARGAHRPRTGRRAASRATPVKVSFPQAKLHLFDAQSGRRI